MITNDQVLELKLYAETKALEFDHFRLGAEHNIEEMIKTLKENKTLFELIGWQVGNMITALEQALNTVHKQ